MKIFFSGRSCFLYLFIALILTSCQTTKTINVEQVRQLNAEFSSFGFVGPKRSSADLLERHSDLAKASCWSPLPGIFNRHLTSKLMKEYFDLRYALKRDYTPGGRGNAKPWYALQMALYAYYMGDTNSARSFTKLGQNNALKAMAQLNWHGLASVFSYMEGVYSAFSGDLENAEKLLAEGLGYEQDRWRSRHFELFKDFFRARLYGAISQMKGKGVAAEKSYREAFVLINNAIEAAEASDRGPNAKYWLRQVFTAQKWAAHAEYASVLIALNRSLEAESVLRSALNSDPTFAFGNVVEVLNGTPTLRAGLLKRLAQALFAQGRFLEAKNLAGLVEKAYIGACARHGLHIAEARVIRAQSFLQLGDYKAAGAAFSSIEKDLIDKEVLEIRFADSIPWAMADLLNGNLDAAEARFIKGQKLIGERGLSGSGIEYIVNGGLGLVMLDRGQEERARSLLGTSVKGLLSARDFGDQWARHLILERYIEFLVSTGRKADVDEAFVVSQGLQNSSVQRALAQNSARAGADNPELGGLIRAQQDLEYRLNASHKTLIAALSAQSNEAAATATSIKERMPALVQALEELKQDIARRFPKYDELINPKPLRVTDVQEALKPDHSLVVVRTLKNSTIIWAISKEKEVAFNSVPIGETALTEVVQELRSAVDPTELATLADIPEFDIASAYNLYKALLKPVEKGWKSTKTIEFIAQGPLMQLPISMLPTAPFSLTDEELLFARYKNVPWLANTHSVVLLPSIGAISTAAKPRKVGPRRLLVAFGDPYFSVQQAKNSSTNEGQSLRGAELVVRSRPQTRDVKSSELAMLPRLPETRAELLSIAKTLKVDPKGSVFLGTEANEANFKNMNLENVDVLAFATHGLVPGDLDGLDQPALALTSPSVAEVAGDGLLTMGEILSAKLNADWVVLSACNTAAADGVGAEAVSGLGRAFFYAGAKSLLVSNWPVHSGATTALMTRLFKLMAEDKTLSRASALQKARIWMIKSGYEIKKGDILFSYAHPIFWAPFVIVGDSGSNL